MKHLVPVALIIILLMLTFVGCEAPVDEVLSSLGDYNTSEFYSEGEFQDYTDYAKYYYDNVSFENNEFFKIMTDTDREHLLQHIENFEQWLDDIEEANPVSELVSSYDFDESVISDDDYLYIYDDPDYLDYGNYDVYFFDTQSLTLYYFHNNI